MSHIVKQMKDLERRILLELLRDAEQPVIKIAEKAGTTRQTASKKIEKFKQSGVVRDFKVELNPEDFGLDVKAYVFLQEDPQDEVRERIEEEINQIPEVSKFYRLFGRYSGVLEVYTGGEDELTSLVKKIHEIEGIRETETFIVHDVLKEEADSPLLNVLREGE